MLPIKRNLSGNATCCMVQQWHLEKANHENSKRTSSCQKLGESRAGMKPRGVLERGICYNCPNPCTVEHWVDPDVNYELWVKMRFDCMATSYDQFWWECRRRGRLCAHKGGGCMCTCQSSFAQEIFDKQFVRGILRDTNSSLSWCACVCMSDTVWFYPQPCEVRSIIASSPSYWKWSETWGDWVTQPKVTIKLDRVWKIGHYTMMLSQATKTYYIVTYKLAY